MAARHRATVRGFVLRVVGDTALADDLTQETFVRAQRAAATFRGEASKRSWLCAIALNLCRDHFRSAARAPQPAPDPAILERLAADDDLEDGLLQREMSACITAYLLRLPAPQRDAVALHDMAGLTHGEVAASLGVSEANSRVLVHRGRAALRVLLERDCKLSLDGDPIPCERKPSQ